MYGFLGLTILMVPIAIVLMITNYRSTNWFWLGFLLLSLWTGIAPYVALIYIVITLSKKTAKTEIKPPTVYHADGSYTVYPAAPGSTNQDAGKTAFRVVGGIIGGLAAAFGLFIIAMLLLIILVPSVGCGGSSKCM